MLQSIRDRATGVFAWVIVVLLIVPFALWGIQEYLGGGSAIVVAKVDDLEITRNALNTQVDRDLRGRKDRPEGAALVAFRRNVLDQMIQEEVLIQAAQERGLSLHEAAIAQQIQANPAFQVDGKFDQQRYEELLRYNNLDPASYQATLARNLVLQQFVGGIQQSSFVTPVEIDQLQELQGRKLNIAYLQLPISQYRDAAKVTDEELTEYYQQHKQNFVTPEKVRLDYLLLDSRDIEKELKFTDEQLTAYYEDNKDSFITPEQRQVAHILVEVPAGKKEADETAAEKRISEVYEKLQQGEDFAKLAGSYSDDAGSAAQGGDIGIIESGTMDEAFEQAASQLGKDEYSKPVRTAFGFHIIKVLDIKPGTNKSFAEVREDVQKMYARQQAENIYLDRKEALYNQTYENPDSLDVAARELALTIKKSDWFSRSGNKDDDIARDRKVVDSAFTGDVFAGGDPARSLNSKIIELKSDNKDASERVVVVRLSDYQPSKPQAMETVKDEIRNTLLNKKAGESMNAEIEAYLKQLREGTDMEQLGKEKSLTYKAAQWVGRSEKGFDSALLNAVFKAIKPEEGKTSYTSARSQKGDGFISAILGVQKGEVKKDDPSRNFMVQIMQRMRSSEELAAVIADLKEQADITIFDSRLANDDS
jgi:peptidyl-prolyl cis-trans isomerase D